MKEGRSFAAPFTSMPVGLSTETLDHGSAFAKREVRGKSREKTDGARQGGGSFERIFPPWRLHRER